MISMTPSKLSFGAIRLDQVPQIKMGTSIRVTGDEEKGDWTIMKKPESTPAPDGCKKFSMDLFRVSTMRIISPDERKTFNLEFNPTSSPPNEDSRFTIVG